jgi:hypothetical protein
MLINISLPGMTELPKNSLVLRRRQKARYQDNSISDENIEIQNSEVVTTSEPIQAIEAIGDLEEVPQEPKKRGRKPKIPTEQIQSTIDKGGRPPLVRNALEDDTAVAPLRRSKRNK